MLIKCQFQHTNEPKALLAVQEGAWHLAVGAIGFIIFNRQARVTRLGSGLAVGTVWVVRGPGIYVCFETQAVLVNNDAGNPL